MMLIPLLMLLLIIIPTPGQWKVGVRAGTWGEMWMHGPFVSAAILLAGWTIGLWGFAARLRAARWFAVAAPFVALFPTIFFPKWLESPIAAALWAAFMSFTMYWVLFRTRACSDYLNAKRKPLGKEPKRSW